jgi:hypothetical protein
VATHFGIVVRNGSTQTLDRLRATMQDWKQQVQPGYWPPPSFDSRGGDAVAYSPPLPRTHTRPFRIGSSKVGRHQTLLGTGRCYHATQHQGTHACGAGGRGRGQRRQALDGFKCGMSVGAGGRSGIHCQCMQRCPGQPSRRAVCRLLRRPAVVICAPCTTKVWAVARPRVSLEAIALDPLGTPDTLGQFQRHMLLDPSAMAACFARLSRQVWRSSPQCPDPHSEAEGAGSGLDHAVHLVVCRRVAALMAQLNDDREKWLQARASPL